MCLKSVLTSRLVLQDRFCQSNDACLTLIQYSNQPLPSLKSTAASLEQVTLHDDTTANETANQKLQSTCEHVQGAIEHFHVTPLPPCWRARTIHFLSPGK